MSELSQRHGNDSSVPTGTEAELGSVLVADDAGTIVATRPRRRVLRWMAGGVLFAAGVGFVTIPLPYYVYSPGQATATEPLITVSGHDSFDPEGHILFTTVTQSEATPFLLTRAWLDDFHETSGNAKTSFRQATRKGTQDQPATDGRVEANGARRGVRCSWPSS